MQTNSNQDLADRMAKKQNQDREQIEALTRDVLELHAKNLKTLSDAAVASTKSVTGEATQALNAIFSGKKNPKGQIIGGILPALQAQEQVLRESIEKQTRHLLWLMKWPVLVTAALCLMICAGTWVFSKMAIPWTEVEMSNGKTYLMLPGDWSVCKTPDGQQPCRPKN